MRKYVFKEYLFEEHSVLKAKQVNDEFWHKFDLLRVKYPKQIDYELVIECHVQGYCMALSFECDTLVILEEVQELYNRLYILRPLQESPLFVGRVADLLEDWFENT